MTLYPYLSRRILLASALASTAVLSGCAVSSSSSPAASPITTLQGRVHGGNQPVGGAAIQLYKANTSDFFGSSTALIPTTVLSNPDGSFNITGTYPGYTCQTGDYLYIVATGGNPGVSGTHNNSALALMAGLGPCVGVTASSFISINELTTVATAWALAPFMQSVTAVATTPTNTTGLGLAFAAINKLVNIQTGAIVGPALPAGATLPIGEINTLADILATCVNSVDTTSPAAQSSSCQTLFTGVGFPASTSEDTIKAALSLAHNPSFGTSLYSLAPGSGAPFEPTLAAAPTNWTIAINYVGGGLSTPKAIAVDQSGNVWIANSGNNSVTKLDNTGAAISPDGGFTTGAMSAPAAIAIDLNGTPWIANSGNNSLTHLSAGGFSGTAYAGGLSTPKSLAIDVVGDVWVGNFGNSTVSEFTNDGTPVTGTGYSAGGINQPAAIAINPL